MYENIGGKIKSLAVWTFIVEAIVSFVIGIIRTVDSEEPIFLLICVLGPIVAWISSWLLYAFGEIAQDIHAIRNRFAPSTEQDAVEEATRRDKEQAAIAKAKQEAEMLAAAKKAAEKIKDAEENASRESLRKEFAAIPPLEKPEDFKPNDSWGIQSLSTKQLVERYLTKDEWSESYRYMCYLELKNRLG